VWLGIEGVRAALLSLDRRGPATTLSDTVPRALGASGAADVATAITDAVYGGSPAALGRLAPLVVSAAESGDSVAGSLVETAVGHLVGTGLAAASGEEPAVVVLAGTLLTRVPPVAEGVRAGLAQQWPDALLTVSVSGEAGATALAIRWSTGSPVTEEVLERLRGGG
jgi:N-acetylglucosamine kinase-like BadF-type ATPase